MYKYPLISSVLYHLQHLPPNSPFTSSAVKMFSTGKMNHQYLPLFLASCFFFISLSQTSSNTSSQHHCLPDQSANLLQLRQEFVEKRMFVDESMYYEYDYHNGSYPKMKSWKADSDCCSWDGVTCDTQNGEVIGLDLSNSWLC